MNVSAPPRLAPKRSPDIRLLTHGLQRAARQRQTADQIRGAADAFNAYLEAIGWQRMSRESRVHALADVVWAQVPFTAPLRNGMQAPTQSRHVWASPNAITPTGPLKSAWAGVLATVAARGRNTILAAASPANDVLLLRNQLYAAKHGPKLEAVDRLALQHAYLNLAAASWEPAEGRKLVSVCAAVLRADPGASFHAVVLKAVLFGIQGMVDDLPTPSQGLSHKHRRNAGRCLAHAEAACAADPDNLGHLRAMVARTRAVLGDAGPSAGPTPDFDLDLDHLFVEAGLPEAAPRRDWRWALHALWTGCGRVLGRIRSTKTWRQKLLLCALAGPLIGAEAAAVWRERDATTAVARVSRA